MKTEGKTENHAWAPGEYEAGIYLFWLGRYEGVPASMEWAITKRGEIGSPGLVKELEKEIVDLLTATVNSHHIGGEVRFTSVSVGKIVEKREDGYVTTLAYYKWEDGAIVDTQRGSGYAPYEVYVPVDTVKARRRREGQFINVVIESELKHRYGTEKTEVVIPPNKGAKYDAERTAKVLREAGNEVKTFRTVDLMRFLALARETIGKFSNPWTGRIDEVGPKGKALRELDEALTRLDNHKKESPAPPM